MEVNHKMSKFLVCLALTVSLVLLVKTIVDFRHKTYTAPEVDQTVYIVYTDEESHPYAIPTQLSVFKVKVPLTNEERDTVASIVAGKAGNKPVSVQLMVANVIRNDILYCGGDIDKAIEHFQLGDYKEPSQDTYDAVDAVFNLAELSLDDDVLYFNDSEHPSKFHNSLTFVCEYFGISFYK